MSNPIDPKLSLEVFFNKQRTKVLFAEANTDFIDVLLSFLTLPLGKVVRILREHDGETAAEIGSLNTLYTGLSNLGDAYFSMPGAKQMLLNPQTSLRAECRKLALDVTDSPPNQYFLCADQNCTVHPDMNISMYSDIATCGCGRPLNRAIAIGEPPDVGGFTINPSSFIITDDLCVASMTGIIQALNNLGNTATQGAKAESVSFGISEIRELLKISLTSATPLTDTIIKKTKTSSTAAAPETEISLHHIQSDDANFRKIVLKVCLQKSTNKFLFAVATDEFMELLFSFLTVPLGGVGSHLGGSTGLKSIDNLYQSVSNVIDDCYFTTPDIKKRLINTKLPLSEEVPPKLYCPLKPKGLQRRKEYSIIEKDRTMVSSFKSSKEVYVKKQTMCIVSDDLTVSPNFATTISNFDGLGILLSDVKEMELHIGLQEALAILKASLTSKTVLTDALIKPMLKKLPNFERQPNQEN